MSDHTGTVLAVSIYALALSVVFVVAVAIVAVMP